MRTLIWVISLVGLIFLLGSVSPCDPVLADSDESAYSSTAAVKGKVTILNHPTLGETAGSSIYLVFQRVDCRKCVIGVWTNIDGQYTLHASAGRYKVIVRDGTRQGETIDILSPKQPRYVEASDKDTYTYFDIQIQLSRSGS